MKTPLWKISLAVWLPVAALVTLGYAIAYGVSYHNAKQHQSERISAVKECKDRIISASQDKTSSSSSVKPDPRLQDIANRYGGNSAGNGIAPAQANSVDLSGCESIDTSLSHGFLWLPK